MDKELLTKEQRIKFALLSQMADYENKATVDFCREAYKFLMENEPKQTIIQHNVDGVFYIYADGTNEPFFGDAPTKSNCIGIGVAWGNRRLVVALHDVANGEDVTLTSKKDETGADEYYIKDHTEAIADWNGELNTQHLKKIGLNPAIELGDGWYIPALGELHFIFANVKDINEALEKAGGEPLDPENRPWYWSSTEYSQAIAWYCGLGNGYIDINPKATNSSRVRPVSAFL